MVNLLRFVDQGFGGLLSAFELIDNSFYKVNTGAGKHAPQLSADQPYYAIIELLGSQQVRDTELFEIVLGEAGERGFFDDAVLARSEVQSKTSWEIREDPDRQADRRGGTGGEISGMTRGCAV